jgi:PAS domain S-box-containing protein
VSPDLNLVANEPSDEGQSEELPDTSAIELLEPFLTLMPDAAVLVDERGLIVSANKLASSLFGYSDPDLIGRKVETLVPERFRHAHREDRKEYAKAPRARTMGAGLDLLGRRRDGSEFPVDISLAPIVQGNRSLVVAAVRDATERRTATAALAQLAAIVQSSLDAMLSMTLEGEITSWNPGAEKLFGYDAADAVGRHISLLIPEDAS